jgi:transcription antitermination factor NusG
MHWYAVYTCANREKRVADYLERIGVENYLPLYGAVRQWSDRRMRLQLPLFPGYVFAHCELANRLRILRTPGVVRLVGAGGHPVPLDTAEIERLREGLARISAEPYPYLTVGQKVRVISGPLMGMTGRLLRRKSGPRVVISIDLIQRSFLADIDSSVLAPEGN